MKFWSNNRENTLQVLVVEPGKAPRSACVSHSVEALRQIVGGELEVMRAYPDGVALVCNRHGKANGLPPNRRLSSKYISGTFFICAISKSVFSSLSARLQKIYQSRFLRPDRFIVVDKKVCCYPEDAIPEIFRLWNEMEDGDLAVIGKIKLSV